MGEMRPGRVRKQYKRDMPMNAADVRFSLKQTLPTGRLMTWLQQVRTFLNITQFLGRTVISDKDVAQSLT